MLDDPSDLTEELTQDLDSLYLSESNFEVEPSQISGFKTCHVTQELSQRI